jgi:hypothetical protein
MTPRRFLAFLGCFLFLVLISRADSRNWQTGLLTATEKQQVPSGSTAFSSTDGSQKKNGDYSENTTRTKSEDYDNYQVFTIQSDKVVYTVRERLYFPWSKPADLSLGQPVRFAVDRNTMYLLDSSEKEHKASIVKSAMRDAP